MAEPPGPPRPPWFVLRSEIPRWKGLLLGLLCIVVCFGLWWVLTRGEAEDRVLSPGVLPSPAETFSSFPSLWNDRALTRNAYASLRRVVLGFGLATVIGVPLGVLCGSFTGFRKFLAPLTVFGRNIPIAALIPLTLSFFGIDEFQKIMFIFIACVAFIITDTANAISEVSTSYLDTAYTLGANWRQVILKVLFPLALPSVCNSLRLLFGLAFGYIMIAEFIKSGDESGGLGYIINISQRLGKREHILLILMVIPLLALAIDAILYWCQRELFPHQYGGQGILLRLVRTALHGWEDFKSLFVRPVDLAMLKHDRPATQAPAALATVGPSPAPAPPPADSTGAKP